MRVNARRVLLAGAIVAAATVGIAPPVAAAPSPGAQVGGLVRTIVIAGRFGVPDDAAMAAVNVTAVAPAAAGYITVYPCGAARPKTSNVNYFADQVVPNLVLSRIGTGGAVCIYTAADTDVVVDLVGYVPAGSALVPLATPVRRLDTRDPGGPPSPVPAGRVTELTITGRDGIPTDANVVMFNATAIADTAPGYLTAYPCGTRPTTSSINYLPGQIVPNLVTSRISAAGSICIYNRSTADFIIDLAAYATDGIDTLPTPKRLIDTRKGGGDVLPARNVLTLDVTARADVPDDATAAIYNLTSVGATAPGYATSYPCNVTRPTVSNLNFTPGNVNANGTITKLSATGELCIFTLAPTHLLVDLIGYTTDATHYTPLTPKRIHDSRNGWQSTCDWILTGAATSTQLRATNLRTGRQIMVERTNPKPQVPPFILPDCTGVRWADQAGGAAWTLRTRSFTGPSPGAVVMSVGAQTTYSDATVLADGRTVGVRTSDGAIIDLLTGSTVSAPPWLGDVASASIVATGYVAVRELGALGAAPFIETYDIATGKRVGVFLIQDAVNTVELSPDGSYLAIDSGVRGQGTAMQIVAPDGMYIDGMISPGPTYQRIIPRFDGTGTVLACIQDVGLQRLDLFATQRAVTTWNVPTLFTTSSGHECERQFWR